ncbi:hypothetical protein FPL04_00800 [Xanthomonas arboricola]|nr:hypothetical protein FPL04_00800 [Xanthomonas arboricola]
MGIPSLLGRRWRAAPDEGTRLRAVSGAGLDWSGGGLCALSSWLSFLRWLSAAPTPAPRPGPRWRRGRSKARAPMARKPCLLAPTGEGLCCSPGVPLPGL